MEILKDFVENSDENLTKWSHSNMPSPKVQLHSAGLAKPTKMQTDRRTDLQSRGVCEHVVQ